MNALLIRNADKLPGLEDNQIKTSCWIRLEKNKVRLVPVDSTYGLTILIILTISVASNFQTYMKSTKIVYEIEILGIE